MRSSWLKVPDRLWHYRKRAWASEPRAFPHDDRPFEERTIKTSYGEQRYDAQAFWIAHASLIGHPALSMPIGQTPNGLPVGAQVIGPWDEDDTPITFAELLAA